MGAEAATMDAVHPIWNTPAVLGVAEAGKYGALIRMTRIARELTLTQAGVLCHLSPSALSRIETGKRPITDITQLRRISATLGIPPELFGLSPPPPGAAAGNGDRQADMVSTDLASEGGEESMRRRELLAGLTGVSVLGLLSAHHTDAHPIPLADLTTGLANAQTAFEACRYHELANRLPGLIATTHASRDAATGHDRERLSAAMSAAYMLASELAVKRNEDAIAWVAADRALAAARDSGDTTVIARGSRARMGSVDTDQRAGTTTFSATNAAVYRIGVHTALGDSGAALRYARSVDPRRLPTAERHARFCVDTARAWEQHGDRYHACHALAVAERQAPEELRRSSVRTLISSLLYAPGPTAPGLRGLATRAGAAL